MSTLNETLFQAISSFIKEYRKVSFNAIEEYEFTPSEIDVMMFLFNNAPLDTAKDISINKGISKALVCRAVDSLIQKGLISTATDEKDRRIIHLALSNNASPIVDKLKTSKKLFGDRILSGISDEEVNAFIKVLNIMKQNVDNIKDE